MICPFAVQKPVSAHGGPTGKVIGVVIHVTAGTGDPYNEFANPANQVSSHFGIGNGRGGMGDGVIEQYVDTAYDSWAQMAGNSTYLSIETEGEPTFALSPLQVSSFAKLMAWAHQNHGIPLVVVDTPGQSGLITHGDGGAAWGGHYNCPGTLRKAQRQQILTAAQLIVTPAPVPQPGGSTVPAPTDTVDAWFIPGSNGANGFELHADGGLFSVGTVTVGQLTYVAVANDSTRWHFGPNGDHAGGVFSYPGLPPATRQGTRYFNRMVVLAYAGKAA